MKYSPRIPKALRIAKLRSQMSAQGELVQQLKERGYSDAAIMALVSFSPSPKTPAPEPDGETRCFFSTED